MCWLYKPVMLLAWILYILNSIKQYIMNRTSTTKDTISANNLFCFGCSILECTWTTKSVYNGLKSHERIKTIRKIFFSAVIAIRMLFFQIELWFLRRTFKRYGITSIFLDWKYLNYIDRILEIVRKGSMMLISYTLN